MNKEYWILTNHFKNTVAVIFFDESKEVVEEAQKKLLRNYPDGDFRITKFPSKSIDPKV